MNEKKFSRVDLLKSLAAVPLGIAALAAVAGEADAKGTKAAFKYQNEPKGKQKCAGCSLFIPGKVGACKVVAGSISPNGWCVAFAPK